MTKLKSEEPQGNPYSLGSEFRGLYMKFILSPLTPTRPNVVKVRGRAAQAANLRRGARSRGHRRDMQDSPATPRSPTISTPASCRLPAAWSTRYLEQVRTALIRRKRPSSLLARNPSQMPAPQTLLT